MDKYSGLKTIGDGTYGSVVKAMNIKTGKTNSHFNFIFRRNRGNKENEKEVLQMGCLHITKRNPITHKTPTSKYCATL